MADFAHARGLRLRPHAKMHKSAALALLQMAHGAVGVCVQKTDEGLALARAGVSDIYISNEVIAPAKLQRLAEAVRARHTRFAIAVDSVQGIDALAAALAHARVDQPDAIDVFIEIDVGHGRCGVPPGDAAVVLAQRLAEQPTMRFAGLQAYHGSAQHLRTPGERAQPVASAAEAVKHTLQALSAQGIEVPLVTGAGTGTFLNEASLA